MSDSRQGRQWGRALRRLTRVLVMGALISLIGAPAWHAAEPTEAARPAGYDELERQAQQYYERGSYQLAHGLYVQADAMALPPEQARWVDFRVADTLWRSQAATRSTDSTLYEQAKHQLEVLVRDISRVEDRDRVWVEVQESLGDFWWTRRDSRNWSPAWQHYQQALDWWAGAKDIELARSRYLAIVWTAVQPPERDSYYYYGYYGNYLPVDVLDNVLKIATADNDRAHAQYLIAMTLRSQGGDRMQQERIPEAFEAALSAGPSTDWYDDALYHYAEWMTSNGRFVPLENGQWRQEPDYVKALELFRRLLREFQKGETRHYDQAKQRIENITKAVVGVNVSHVFLPGSEIQLHLSWRNVKRIDLALYRVDLTRDLTFAQDASSGDWVNQIDVGWLASVKAWTEETDDDGKHVPGQKMIHLDEKLPVGAYLIEAKGGGEKNRDVVLVTDASLVVKTADGQALAYFCDSRDGSPIADAPVLLWEHYYTGNDWAWRRHTGATDEDGLALFELPESSSSVDLFMAAASGDRQAFSAAYGYGTSSDKPSWRIYAFTDRPAYRPGETVQWKVIARRYHDAVYSTPGHQTIEYEITDPRGASIEKGTLALNAFGSAWDALEVTAAMPLGAYQVAFWSLNRTDHIGSATLFRLEEYKLPEFTVTVKTPEEDGQPKTFRVGDTIEINVQANYYFGGPVANATAEVLVYQNPFSHWWVRPHAFPWFYDHLERPRGHYWGQGQVIKRETLKTDATGKATLTFETPRNAQQDFEYRIEARVTDASRREIVGSGTVRVTRQRHYVYLHPAHYLYKPQDVVSIDVKALDANDRPVQVEGTVTVTRDAWYEIWLNPNGKEVTGPKLRALREQTTIFPPPPDDPDGRPWRLKFRGYEHDEILTRTIKTTAEGEAEFTFTPARDGYYRVAWSSEDPGSVPVTADTTVWVATHATTDLGYRHGGVQIIVDKDTFHAGQDAPVMLVAPTNDRYVLFTVEGEMLDSYQLVHLTGTVKLLELPIREAHVPNTFLSAALVSDHQLFIDTKQVVVPPVEQFLEVEVLADRDQYQPREDGTLTVRVRDHDGNPVAAEVALGLVDESVYYIQQDYAQDPRQFYYGTKRTQRVRTQSTFQWRGYTKLVEGDGDTLIDERLKMLQEAQQIGGIGGGAYRRGSIGGRFRDSKKMMHRQEFAKNELKASADSFNGELYDMAEAPMLTLASEMLEEDRADAPPASKGPDTQTDPAVTVRSDFRSTIFWQPDVVTDRNGEATVDVTFADSLTQWRSTARVATQGNRFGIATTHVRTRQPLIVRLQAPRFFVVGDAVTISAVLNNNTEEPMRVTPSLHAEGVVVTGVVEDGRVRKGEPGPVTVEANGEARVDWHVSVQQAGDAKLTVTARGDTHADAMEKRYVVHEHGIEKFVAKAGKVRGEEVAITLDIPAARKADSTILTVQVAPSMAVTMLDALPYLADYPYGCTEQTMSRFLPAVITAKTLKDLGLSPEAVSTKLFGGIEPEHVEKTHPKGQQGLGKLDDMVRKGLDRLYDFQHSDGGWGWWKKGDSDHFMTGYVVWGLTLAREADVDVRPDVLSRAVDYLQKEIVEEERHHDLQAWMLHALAVHHASTSRSGVHRFERKAFDNLWTSRGALNAYTRSLLALSAHHYGRVGDAALLIENLENGVKIDTTPDTSVVQRGAQTSHEAVIGTAHWGEDGIYWRWSQGGVEATAFALRALLAIDPDHKLIEPVTNWLIKNRRGAQWSNTRDTAIAVLTLNEYLRHSGELSPELEYEVLVNGRSIIKRRLTAEDALTAPSVLTIDPNAIRDGANTIRIVRRNGNGPIYFAARAVFFSLEEPITPAGHEIFVRRQYYKLVGRPTLLKGYVYEKVPLNDGDTVTSGERVEAVITIEAKNNYEYLVFEDLKPAGLEAVQVRSGEDLYTRELKASAHDRRFGNGDGAPATDQKTTARSSRAPQLSTVMPHPVPDTGTDYTGRTRWVYQELRDRNVALFIDKLPQGIWEIRYDLRAEVPGEFHALPVMGHAMYVPEIRANGAEVRITVQDSQ